MQRRKRHSPDQIIAKLREADAMLAGGIVTVRIRLLRPLHL